MSTPAIEALRLRRKVLATNQANKEETLRRYRREVNHFEGEVNRLNEELTDIDRALAALSYRADLPAE